MKIVIENVAQISQTNTFKVIFGMECSRKCDIYKNFKLMPANNLSLLIWNDP